jgi:hypothetical protein
MCVPRVVLVRRSLVAFIVYTAVIGGTPALAQTVIVRHAPAGSTVELVMDATVVVAAKADAAGNATLTAPDKVDVPLDAGVWVDVCGDVHRVILARRGAQPAAEAVCRRLEVAGLFFVQRITSMVIDVRDAPSLRLRQGRAPDEWLRDPVPGVARAGANAGAATQADAPAAPLPPLTGLTLFGGIGRGSATEFESQACGNVTSCSDGGTMPYTGGLAWWFTDFVAAEARYNYLGDHEAAASGNAFRFTTTREGGVLAFTGRGGVRLGRVRPFGRAGMSFHSATLTTTQTVDATSVVIDGVTQTVPGGTQILQSRTTGWAPVYGGGAEIWLSSIVGIFGEFQRIELKGSDDRGADIEINDAEQTIQAGVTVRFP